MNKGITLGEWKPYQTATNYEILVGDTDDTIADVYSCHIGLARANAEFICLCANECQLINKEHPEYVAEKIGEMAEVLKDLVNKFRTAGIILGFTEAHLIDELSRADKVLAEIERKG